MRKQAASLIHVKAVRSLELSRIDNPALRGGSSWNWLIEMHVDRAEDAVHAARDPACRDLVADLRLLGMHPCLVLADVTQAVEG
jgi:hypothetical protein